ncbi:hypothetical protein HY449_04755 [Candidatus Pacearchaeota archaeon]|nr:hypothetical protein [Candidatus Pacearchaeota archaeon]
MEEQKITIPVKEYMELKRYKEVDEELLTDIAAGIKDILNGNVEEV